MDLKRFAKALLFPHISLMIILVPISTAYLICSLVFIGTNSVVAIASYVLSAYTLTVWCLKVPRLLQLARSFKENNRYAKRWLSDEHLRVNVSLYGTLIWNVSYGVFQLWLGFYHRTFWFYSLAGYYICLAIMRFFLVRHTRAHAPGDQILDEYVKYRICGSIFLLMNLSLAAIVFFMVYWNRTFIHHEITTIAMAAYTFASFSVAIVNVIKYRKYNSPVYSASKAISLAAVCVSLLTLESTMLTTFGGEDLDLYTRRMLLGISGAVISLFVVGMAVYMITQSTKKLKSINTIEEKTSGKQ